MGGKVTFTFESREQINEMFSLNVHFTSNLNNFVLDSPKAWRGTICFRVFLKIYKLTELII